MTYLESVLLGILQGLTEFLPVSSSGQLVIAEHFFGLSAIDPTVMKDFDIFLHTGTLLALFILFWHEFVSMFTFLYKKFIQLFGLKKELNEKEAEAKNLIIYLILATLPVAFVGFFFEDTIDLTRKPLIVAMFLGLTALLFLLAEKLPAQKTNEKLTLKNTLTMGFFQIIGLFPGISRSGSTISGGLFTGLKREKAAYFSFMLAVPAILGATILSVKDMLSEDLGALNNSIILVGFLSSFVVSYFTAKFLLIIFKKLSLNFFAIILFIESALLMYFS